MPHRPSDVDVQNIGALDGTEKMIVDKSDLTEPMVTTPADIKAYLLSEGLITDAPNDGKIYVRRNNLWEELVIA